MTTATSTLHLRYSIRICMTTAHLATELKLLQSRTTLISSCLPAVGFCVVKEELEQEEGGAAGTSEVPAALLFANQETVVAFHLKCSHFTLPACVQALLSDPGVVKWTLNVRTTFRCLDALLPQRSQEDRRAMVAFRPYSVLPVDVPFYTLMELDQNSCSFQDVVQEFFKLQLPLLPPILCDINRFCDSIELISTEVIAVFQAAVVLDCMEFVRRHATTIQFDERVVLGEVDSSFDAKSRVVCDALFNRKPLLVLDQATHFVTVTVYDHGNGVETLRENANRCLLKKLLCC